MEQVPSTSSPTVDRLEDQSNWYDRKSVSSQRSFIGLKMAEIAAAALIPFAVGFGVSAYITGGLGVLITVLEGLLNLFQYHSNWITYRSTCEELKHEKYLWLAKAGPYEIAASPDTLLAERVESLVSREHARWVSSRDQAEKQNKTRPLGSDR